MTDFEQAVLGLLLLQTAFLSIILWLCIRQEIRKVRQQSQAIYLDAQRLLSTFSLQQLEAPAVQEYLKWTKYPRTVLSQYRLTRKFYRLKLHQLRALLKDNNEF